MRVDLHIHTIYSGDSDLDPRHLITRAKELSLDALCITEHNSYEKAAPVLAVGKEMDFPVLRGVEIATTLGHLLVYGLKDDGWKRWHCWGRLPGEEVLEVVAGLGGVVILAHPYKPGYQFYRPEILPGHPEIVAMEIANGECSAEENDDAKRLAQQLGLPGTGGSDAHRFHEIGLCYTEFPGWLDTEGDLVAALKAGNFRAVNHKK